MRGTALAAGPHTISWDRVGESGRAVPGGVYFVRLRAGDDVRVSRVTLLRLKEARSGGRLGVSLGRLRGLGLPGPTLPSQVRILTCG